jgi:hypothetical protein
MTMRDWMRRALRAHPELAAELWRRDLFTAEEKRELLACFPPHDYKLPCLPLGSVQFATLLAEGDTQLAAHVVLRDRIRPNELSWLDRLLRFKRPNDKRNELCRIVERALEGRKENARSRR